MSDSQQDILIRLGEIYTQKLFGGPFPSKECEAAWIRGRFHGELILYLADIAGIASHGVKLANLEEPRRTSFVKLASQSFFDRHPEAKVKITPIKTPVLFQLMADTEEARLLINQYFNQSLLLRSPPLRAIHLSTTSCADNVARWLCLRR
jgi:hypothetical protein